MIKSSKKETKVLVTPTKVEKKAVARAQAAPAQAAPAGEPNLLFKGFAKQVARSGRNAGRGGSGSMRGRGSQRGRGQRGGGRLRGRGKQGACKRVQS